MNSYIVFRKRLVSKRLSNCGVVDMRRSLWREDGSVSYIWRWVSQDQSFSGPSPAGLMTIFYCPKLEISPTLSSRLQYLFPQDQGVDVRRSLWWEDGSVSYSCCWASSDQSFLGPSSVGLIIVFYCPKLEISQTLSARLQYLFPQEQGVDVRRSLWREDGSVSYSCCWASPEQSFSGPISVGLIIIFYCPKLEISPTLSTKFQYLFPQGSSVILTGTGFLVKYF
jgi:hypothetical protein